MTDEIDTIPRVFGCDRAGDLDAVRESIRAGGGLALTAPTSQTREGILPSEILYHTRPRRR